MILLCLKFQQKSKAYYLLYYRYSSFEGIYCKVLLEEPIEVKAEQKLKITEWTSKNELPGDYVYNWYGQNGGDYATCQNEHMGLFRLEETGDSGNGTSIYSGQIPQILYYL
jgi:hypothetical protein